jgi:hypothetical protein
MQRIIINAMHKYCVLCKGGVLDDAKWCEDGIF